MFFIRAFSLYAWGVATVFLIMKTDNTAVYGKQLAEYNSINESHSKKKFNPAKIF